jgi:hypothetical protein
MSQQHYSEKHEKEEKEDEKTQEKSPQEKSWDEKWHRDPVSAVVWALIFIWAGFILLLNNLGTLDSLLKISLPNQVTPIRLEIWSIILIGAGIIVLAEVLVRLLIPIYRRPIGGSIFVAILLIGIGLGDIFGMEIVMPLILIALGLSVLLRGFMRRT